MTLSMIVPIRSLLTSNTHPTTTATYQQENAPPYNITDNNHTEAPIDNMLNYIYPGIRIFALLLTGIAVVVTIYCVQWIYQHRKERIIKSHQPEFLFAIGFGVLLWEISVIPLSIDDSIASDRGSSIACVAEQWLYNIGFTISFAGLYSKLWRINKIFHNPQFRRISVTVSDVLKPFAILFSYTFIILLVWTIIDPPKWVRIKIDATYTYGSCQSDNIGQLLEWLLFLGHILVVLATIRQAYMARNVSSDFSETWPLALALLNWIQLAIIGIPVQALIEYIVPSAAYFLAVSVVLAQSLSMLFAIFFPLYLHPSIRNPPPALGHTVHVTRNNHVNITGATINESTIYNDDEKHHDEVVERLGFTSISNHTPEKTTHKELRDVTLFSTKGEGEDETRQQPQQLQQSHDQGLSSIVESSSELKDSSTSNDTTTINNKTASVKEGVHHEKAEERV